MGSCWSAPAFLFLLLPAEWEALSHSSPQWLSLQWQPQLWITRAATFLLKTEQQAHTDQQPNVAAEEEGLLHLQQVLGTDTSAYKRKWLKIYNSESKVYNLKD